MRDLFERFRAPANPGATGATRATDLTKPGNSERLQDGGAVAHRSGGLGNMGNTRPGGERAVALASRAAARGNTDVTLLPKPAGAWVTGKAGEKPKQDKGFSPVLPMLPLLPSENTQVANVARAHALLAETFERIAGWWVEGAGLPPVELEADIDRAVLAGDLGALRAALRVYEQAARERCSAAPRNRTGRHGEATQEG